MTTSTTNNLTYDIDNPQQAWFVLTEIYHCDPNKLTFIKQLYEKGIIKS